MNKELKEKANSISPVPSGSPTLTELNSLIHLHSSKRPSLPPTTLSPNHHSSYLTNVGDSSTTSIPSPQMAFGDKEAGFEDLSASFRSLYKSLFDSSSFNTPTQLTGPQHLSADPYYTANLPPTQPIRLSSTIGYSTHIGTTTSRPLASMAAGGSTLPPSLHPPPPFTSLMDNLKNIAENNQWELLNPSQIQSLKESFKSGNHNTFGMDQDSFLEWSHSFNQFLTQLDSRIPFNTPPPPAAGPLPHSSFQLPPTDQLPPPPPYPQHTSTANSYNTTGGASLTDIRSSVSEATNHKVPVFKSVATDLLEDDDDFDWSKLV